MQLDNDLESFVSLITSIHSYYKKHGNRPLNVFFQQPPKDNAPYLIRYLVDRKHVVEYAISYEPRISAHMAAIRLGIGPAYFDPVTFWGPEESARFSINATTEAIVQNLEALDEFLGYR